MLVIAIIVKITSKGPAIYKQVRLTKNGKEFKLYKFRSMYIDAEKNGAQPKFVEDAIRYIADELNRNKNILDYKVVCSHLESLHAHNAVAVITKGTPNSIFNHHVSHEEWLQLASL